MGVRFKQPRIFTNALLHTQDTTQLLRDMRPEEMNVFAGDSVSHSHLQENLDKFDEVLTKTTGDCDAKDLEIIAARLEKAESLFGVSEQTQKVRQLLNRAKTLMESAE